MTNSLEDILICALDARAELFDARHEAAFRLFNGFTEGWPTLAVDLYAQTLVLHDYSETPEQNQSTITAARQFYQLRLPWISAVLLKTRNATTPDALRALVAEANAFLGLKSLIIRGLGVTPEMTVDARSAIPSLRFVNEGA